MEDGYHPVPQGKLASVQTFLEMVERPALRPSHDEPSWSLQRLGQPDLARYRALFHRVGDDYLWASRLVMPEVELERVLSDPRVEVYILVTCDGDEGIIELDFRPDRECELSLFGVAAPLVGTGAGRWLINHAIDLAWSHPIKRFWLHTCTLDHPNALSFYKHSGFRPFKREVEVYDDPRYLGLTRADVAPQVPIL